MAEGRAGAHHRGLNMDKNKPRLEGSQAIAFSSVARRLRISARPSEWPFLIPVPTSGA
jgi:hypothetical protein